MKRNALLLIPLILALGFSPTASVAAEFSDWSPPVSLGPVINSPYLDSCVSISKNGLSLFFSSSRQNPTTPSNRDLYVTQRESTDVPWGLPEPLTMLNTSAWESCPALSLDEHRLYFTSQQPGGCGGADLWVSHRHDRRDDFGWDPPVHLGCEQDDYVNSIYDDLVPTLFEDESGKVWMYFCRGVMNSTIFGIYQSEMRDDGTFGPATPVSELNGPYNNLGVTVRRDGLEIIFLSHRPPGISWEWGLFDFWRATRASTSDPWSEPELVTSLGNPALAQGRLALSFDGRELYFTSYRGGPSADLYVAKREKLQGEK